MKHNLKITIILLSMFLLTQFIGLTVQSANIFYLEQEVNGTVQTVPNPYLSFIAPPEAETTEQSFGLFGSLVVAFVIAISLFFLFTKFKIEFLLRIWFFAVVVIALFLSIYAFEKLAPFSISAGSAIIIALALALPLAVLKIFRKNFLIHNFTELLIYPGISLIFVPILNVYTVVALLILISAYDMWAVWKSGIMQKMAKYQMDKLQIFGGFMVPHVSKSMKAKIKKMKEKFNRTELRKKKIKINIAILGGGDVVFPIITAGVMLNSFGLTHALFVILGATAGLTYLFFSSEKKKFYPAMPFITTGIFLGMILAWLIL